MKMTPFQYVIMGIFVALLLVGVSVFAIFGGKDRGKDIGEVVIWGTLESSVVKAAITALIPNDQAFQRVSYVQKRPETYEADLINAFASNQAPDLFLIDDTEIMSFKDKIARIPYDSISQRAFSDTYIDEGKLFLLADGIAGLPLYVNPLVMYWNRDLFAGSGIPTYPRAWSEIAGIAPRMTALDTASNVKRSAVALGTYDNVLYAREILIALLLQLNNQIVGFDPNGKFVSLLSSNPSNSMETPAAAVVRFFTSFSNSSQTVYSWNRSLPNSFNAFSSGDLGIYFGFASDYQLIMTRNPNLSFGVATLPQTGSSKFPVTYGRLVGLAIPRSAKNQVGAAYVAQAMTGQQGSQIIASTLGLPSARRDLLAVEPSDPAQSVFAQSALISRGWYDPGVSISGPIFKTVVESTISGKSQLGNAIIDASADLTEALTPFNTTQ